MLKSHSICMCTIDVLCAGICVCYVCAGEYLCDVSV